MENDTLVEGTSTPEICTHFAGINDSECAEIAQFYNDTVSFERFIGWLIPTIFVLIVIVGIVGNLLVVIVALNRQMRNSTNTLIIGLALSDLMFLLICIPITALDYATNTWVLPEWMCSLINYCQHISAYFSVWTLTLMALDRFLAVCFPVGSMTLRNTRNTVITLLVVYSIIALTQIPIAFLHGLYEYEFVIEMRSACAYITIATGQASVFEPSEAVEWRRVMHVLDGIVRNYQTRAYFVTFNIFGYLLPLGITTVLYYCMLKRLWHTPRPGASSISSSMRNRPETVRAKRKVTRLVLSVIVIWAVCWLPINICFFLSGMAYPDSLVMRGGKFAVVMQIASQVLAYTNSCLNPILYALMSENFRKGFHRILAIVTNHLTRGIFCNSDMRSMSRMDVSNYNNNQTSSSNPHSIRGKKPMAHAYSAPFCGISSTSTNKLNQRAFVALSETSSLLAESRRLLPAAGEDREGGNRDESAVDSCKVLEMSQYNAPSTDRGKATFEHDENDSADEGDHQL